MRPTRVACLVMLWLLTNATWAFSQSRLILIPVHQTTGSAKVVMTTANADLAS